MPPQPVDPRYYVTENRQLQAALGYARRGLHVYPCRPGDKRPAGQWGAGATTGTLTLVELWLAHPGANILVTCGPASGVTVLDFDVKRGMPGETLAAELLGPGWKNRHCYTTTPSGGYHVWVPHVPEWGNQKHVPGLDCQGEGSYVLAPPSVLVAGQCGEGDVPGPYLLVNPHLPLVEPLDPDAHARVTARLGHRIREVPTQSADLPEGWEVAACPSWDEVLPLLADRVRHYLRTGDPDARPPGDESARPFDTRNGGVMAVATNLLALKGDADRWRLTPAQVLHLLAEVGHIQQYAVEHAGGTGRAPWWLWRYNVVPARDRVRRSGFEGVVEDGPGGGAPVVMAGGSTAQAEEKDSAPRESARADDGGLQPDSTATDDLLQPILAYVARMGPPYDAGVREVCHAVALAGVDELAQARVIDALAEQTDLGRPLLKRQLAGAVRVVVRERRDAAKRAPTGVTASYVYVEQAGALWKLTAPGWVTVAAFRAMWGADASLAALEPDGGVRRCSRATYRPGAQWAPGFDREAARWVLDDDTQQWRLNTWEPSPLVPMTGATDEDVAPWLAHLDDVLKVPAGVEREHLLDWLAFTVAMPGTKVNHMLLLGGGQGAGKDTLLEPVVRAVGRSNALVVGGAEALAGFDSEKLGHSCLMVLQELSTGDLAEARRAYNTLKTYIAAPPDTLMINVKGVKQYEVPNLVSVAAVTNDRRALQIEQDDRRAFMVWCEGRADRFDADQLAAYFDGLWGWYDTGGAEAVVGWLLQRDLSAFKPRARPPGTAWRGQAQEDSLTDVAQVVRDLITEGEGPAADEVVRAVDLLPLVRVRMIGAKHPPTERGIGYALTELGYPSKRVNESRATAREAGRDTRRKATYYLLRNEAYWTTETLRQKMCLQ